MDRRGFFSAIVGGAAASTPVSAKSKLAPYALRQVGVCKCGNHMVAYGEYGNSEFFLCNNEDCDQHWRPITPAMLPGSHFQDRKRMMAILNAERRDDIFRLEQWMAWDCAEVGQYDPREKILAAAAKHPRRSELLAEREAWWKDFVAKVTA